MTVSGTRKEGSSLLAALSEFDPSLRDGGRLVLERLCNVELRLPPEHDEDASVEGKGTMSVSAGTDKLIIKIVAFYDEEGGPEESSSLNSMVIEILSESDVFFHYAKEINRAVFLSLRQAQRLMVTFDEFPDLLADLAGQCAADLADESSVRCSFVLVDSQTARIDFISVQHAFRYIELLTLDLDVADQRDTQLLIAYRFNELRSRLAFAEARYNDLSRAVQTKYPHILTSREGPDTVLSSPSRF